MDDHERQRIIDEEHLKFLRIGHFVMGGMNAFMAFCFLFYIVLGLLLLVAEPSGSRPPDPAGIGIVFVFLGIMFPLFFGLLATLNILAGRAIGRRRSRALCFVAGAASCLFLPHGTFLGVCTFMTLGRESVKRLFDAEASYGERAALSPPPPLTYSSIFTRDEEER